MYSKGLRGAPTKRQETVDSVEQIAFTKHSLVHDPFTLCMPWTSPSSDLRRLQISQFSHFYTTYIREPYHNQNSVVSRFARMGHYLQKALEMRSHQLRGVTGVAAADLTRIAPGTENRIVVGRHRRTRSGGHLRVAATPSTSLTSSQRPHASPPSPGSLTGLGGLGLGSTLSICVVCHLPNCCENKGLIQHLSK
jgi:hypothetical protein